MTDYRPREIAGPLAQALARMPVVVLSGLRQCGKSTLLTHEALAGGREYRTLDEFPVLAAARNAPEALIEGTPAITIDEVQRCPELLAAIKMSVDRQRQPGRFLLSGSANLALMAQVSETLAGRAVYFPLHPMTRREIRGATARQPFLIRFMETERIPREAAEPVQGEEILNGGLPPVCLHPWDAAGLWFRGYVQTYVERDLRQLSQVNDLVTFRAFVSLAALRTAQVLNISALARDARLTGTTATRYLNLLEASYLIRRLPPFLNNRSSRLIKSPKLYFTDSGLAGHLAQVTSLDPTVTEPMRGALLETWALQNLSSILEAHMPEASLSYWHEQSRQEVDLVIGLGGKVWAIEFKSSSRWTNSDLAGLKAFRERTPQCEAGILAYNGKAAVSLGNRLWAIPLAHLVM